MRPKVLIVDDESIICRMLTRLLGEAFEVTALQNPVDARARLEQERFDLVLTDLRMPKVTGHDILACAVARDPSPPVVVMSGHAAVTDERSALLRAGAAGFLTKPFPGREKLVEYLQSVLASQSP